MYKEEENIEPEFSKRYGSNPFRVPEGYFDSLDDRIMNAVTVQQKKRSNPVTIIRILKPALSVAASIALVYLIFQIPFSRNTYNKELVSGAISSSRDDSTLNMSMIDENTLVNAIFSEEKSKADTIKPDEMLAYLSSGLNEVQIYSEIQK